MTIVERLSAVLELPAKSELFQESEPSISCLEHGYLQILMKIMVIFKAFLKESNNGVMHENLHLFRVICNSH